MNVRRATDMVGRCARKVNARGRVVVRLVIDTSDTGKYPLYPGQADGRDVRYIVLEGPLTLTSQKTEARLVRAIYPGRLYPHHHCTQQAWSAWAKGAEIVSELEQEQKGWEIMPEKED